MSRKENNITVVLLIIVAIVFFILGGGAGIFYQTQKQLNDSKIQQAIKLEPTVKTLTSKAIQEIPVYGQVDKIDGRNIKLNYNGDETTINIASSSQIFSGNSARRSQDGKFNNRHASAS